MPKSIVPLSGEPRKFARAAFLLYGAQHIGPIARLLGVDRKTVYRWRSGATPVPAYVWEPLMIALMKRRNDIESTLKGIGEYGFRL